MLELIERLEALGRINEQLAGVVIDPQCDRLVAMRADFSFECNRLLNSLTAKIGDHSKAILLSRLQDEFLTMHRVLSQHQQNWNCHRIENDPGAYADASHLVNGIILGFVERSLTAITAHESTARAA